MVPVVVVFVLSYLVANSFFSVYEMVVDSLYLCYAEDLSINKSYHLDEEDFSHADLRVCSSLSSRSLQRYMVETLKAEGRGQREGHPQESIPLKHLH